MAGRRAYDRIWLAIAGAVEPARLRDLTLALERAAAPNALEIRPVVLERLPDGPPPEHSIPPRRTAVLLLLGEISAAGAQLARLNSVVDFVRAECRRRQWLFEVVDFGNAAATLAALRGQSVLSANDPAGHSEAVGDRLLDRLFTPPRQEMLRQEMQLQEMRREEMRREEMRELRRPDSAAATGAEPPTRGIEPRAAPSRAAPAEPEPVRLGASAPAQAAPGSEFSVRFVAYPPAEEAEVARLLTELSARSEHRLNVHECRWQPGTVVTVHVAARQLEIAPTEQTFTWDGHRVLLDFDATVADTATEGVVVLKLDVAVEGIVVARLRLDLSILRAADAAQPGLATTISEPAQSAFASYSSKDRERVLDRLAAVRIATGLDVFLDCLSLNPGEEWKPRLEREIKGRDLFLLFWSPESAASPWVEWEWRTALAEKGREAMQVHPLATGVKPPPELKDLHFGDVYMLVREAQVARRT